MATREYYLTPLGKNLESAVGNNWQIAGIIIDNPSGSWLLVDGINQYVPPFVGGWSYPFIPSQANVSVRFVDSPSGSASQLIGGIPRVILTDSVVPVSNGFPTGTGRKVTTIPRHEFASLFAQASANGLPDISIFPTITVPRIVRRLVLAIDQIGSVGGIRAIWFVSGISAFNWTQVCTPEAGQTENVFDEGAFLMLPGDQLGISVRCEDTAQGIFFIAQVEYYDEVTP